MQHTRVVFFYKHLYPLRMRRTSPTHKHSFVVVISDVMGKFGTGIFAKVTISVSLTLLLSGPIFADSTRSNYKLISRINPDEFFKISIPSKLDAKKNAPLNTYNVVLLTYYPDFSSAEDYKNRGYGKDCAGYCGGRIVITISYNYSPKNADAIMNLYNYVSSNKDAVIVNSGYENSKEGYVRYSIDDAKLNSPKEYYFTYVKKDMKSYNASFICSPHSPYPSCTIDFYLECDNTVMVHISSVSYNEISVLIKEKNNVSEFVRGMIDKISCKSV